jgi:TP901 family phage tail tape measure protein
MARTGGIISIGADTRQLERDIQSALSKDFKLKGLNEKAFTQPLGRITGAANEFQKSLDASNARVIAFGASAGLIYTVEKAFIDLIKSSIDVQKSLADINVILNTSTEGLSKFGATLFDIAKNTGQSFQTVAVAATELARQGLGVEETLKRTSDALILTRLSGLDANSAVEALTATINSFNKTALDSTGIVNKLANVDAAFAVSSGDLVNALQRVGSSAQDAGVGFDQLIGIVTSVQQTTARGGAVIGNSLKTIFTRIQRTEVLDQLQALGLNVRDLEGNTLPAISILKELATTFDGLSDSQKSQTGELVGGVFQINILKAALGDLGKQYSVYDRAVQTSASSTNEAIKRNEALNQTLSSLFNATLQNVTQIGSTVGSGALQPAIEGTLKNVNKLLEAINNQDSEGVGAKLGGGILKGLSTFISGPGIVLITAVIGKLSLDLAKFAGSGVKALLGINDQTAIRAQLQSKINDVLLREPELLAAINSKQITVLDVETKILRILQEQNALRAQATTLSNSVTTGLLGKGVGVSKGQITTKSSGFIPNFALSEIYGALAGGYKPGQVKEMNMPGSGRIIYNSAETIKKFPGMAQPAIMPPQASAAGKNYENSFESTHGFNPYASSGFIPNFAKNSLQSAQSLFSEAQKEKIDVEDLIKKRNYTITPEIQKEINAIKINPPKKTTGGKGETVVYDASKLGIVGVGGIRGTVNPETSFKTLGYTKDPRSVKFEGIQARTLEDLKNSQKIKNQGTFSTEINKLFIDPLAKLADEIFGPLSPDPKFRATLASNNRKPGINLFPGGTEGSIFEAAVNLGTKKGGGLEKAFDQNTAQKPFDFEESSPPATAFNDKFQFNPAVLRADAKRTITNAQAREIIDKSYRDAIVKSDPKLPKPRLAALGFVPNFSALQEAVSREVSAGVPKSKIRVDRSNKLIGSNNPFGLGVYNTQDEPFGLQQGISSKKSIQQAKTSGAFSSGFIPNFALQKITNIGSAPNGMPISIIEPAEKEAVVAIQQLIRSVFTGKISLDDANKELVKLTNQYRLIDAAGGKVETQLSRASQLNQKLNTETEALVAQSSSLLRGRRALTELEARAAAGGTRGEIARGGLERAQNARSQALGRLQNIGIGLSIGAPIAAQTFAQFNPQSKVAAGTAEGIGTAASFAGLGALFGAPGIAIGALVGSAIGLKKAFDIINSRANEFSKQAEKSGNDLARFSEDVQAFLISKGQAQGLRSGEIKGTGAELQRVEKNQANSLAKIFNSAGPEITNQIKDALESGNEETLREALGRATVAKESAKSIDDFTSSVVRLKEEGKLKDTFDENISAFSRLRTRSGDTFAELVINNEKLMQSLTGYANAVELTSFTTSKGLKDLEDSSKGFQDNFGFNVSKIENGPKSIMQTGTATFTDQEINKRIEELKAAYAESVDGLVSQLTTTVPSDFLAQSENVQKAYATQSLTQELAKKNLESFGGELNNFVDGLVESKDVTKKNGADIKDTFKMILQGDGDPKDKIQKIIEEFKNLGSQGELVAQTLQNIRDKLFNFSQLSQNLNQLFTPGNGAGDVVASEKRQAALNNLKSGNFQDLFKDTSFKDTQINSILGKTVQETLGKIASGTVDEEKRKTEAKKFQEEFVKELEAMTNAGVPYEIALAKISAAAERTAVSSSISSTNLGDLAKNISSASLREDTLNRYREIEIGLRKQYGDDTAGLAKAAEAAKLGLLGVAQAAEGRTSRKDLNSIALSKAQADMGAGAFQGLDLRQMGKTNKIDLQEMVKNTGAQTINAINEGIFDPETKKKLIDQAIIQQEKMISKINEGSVTTRDVSDYKNKNQTIQNSSALLQNGFDRLNQSVYTASAREDAKSALAEQLRKLEDEYKGNLEALNRVAPLLANKLAAIAGAKEGSVFADELRSAGEAERTARIREKKFKASDPFAAFSEEMTYGTQDMARDVNSTFVDTARTMKSEFNNAFQSVIDGTKSVDDAFRTMALNIANKIQQLALEMATNSIFNSLFSSIGGVPALFKSPLGAATGGMIVGNTVQRFSSGGRVLGGSGIKDDVPAMLSKGEYVVKKSAVSRYGEPFLRKLNEGGLIGMASGGFAGYNPSEQQIDSMTASANIEPLIVNGKEVQGRVIKKEMIKEFQSTIKNLISGKDLSFSDQNSTLESFSDVFGGGLAAELGNVYTYNDDLFPTGGSNILNPMLSDLARTDPNNPQTKIIEDKRNRLIDYLSEAIGIYYNNRDSAVETIRNNLENRSRIDEINKQNKDNYNKQMKNTFFGGLMSAGMAIGGGLLGQFIQGNGLFGPNSPRDAGTSGLNLGNSGRLSTSAAKGASSAYSPNLQSPSARLNTTSTSQVSNLNPYVGTSARLNYTPPTMSQYNNAKVYGAGLGQIGGGGNPYSVYNRANGGIIGFAKGGSTGKDDVPAMLMGGEYVIKKDSVSRYGKKFFDNVNSGKVKKFAEGGMVDDGNGSQGFPLQSETTKNGDTSNNINISINIDQNGNSKEEKNNNTSGSQNSGLDRMKNEKDAKALSEKIKTEVVKIITEQQRPGGMLSSSVYKKVK